MVDIMVFLIFVRVFGPFVVGLFVRVWVVLADFLLWFVPLGYREDDR